MTDTNVNTSAGEFDIPMDLPAAEATPAEQLQSTLSMLEKLTQGDPPPATPEPVEPPAAEPVEPPAQDTSEIDAIMAALEDEPQAIQDAVRASLEKGMKLEAALNDLQRDRAAETDARMSAIAEENLVSEATALATKYPGFSEADLVTTLDALSKMPKALAEELTLEEVAARTLGRDALDSRRTVAGTTTGRPPAVPRTADPAVVIGDATPGPGSANMPFDAGTGGDFMDIANFVTKTAGNSLVAGAQR